MDAEIARTDDGSYGATIWVAMVLSCGAFLVAAVVFARRDLASRTTTSARWSERSPLERAESHR